MEFPHNASDEYKRGYRAGHYSCFDRFEEGKNRMALRVEVYRIVAALCAVATVLEAIR